eukprot:CAMPEP_0198212176 /NCGR_PEP_ID=MMETSP1445-20131203/25566_1 /TAXON_ID=36898 /ORGANISM="Pyramimonas sp., Strain CCMP2087" /LENGTH=146 /DNA_ID=CAMNT_0043886571 /DNA_START=202 /DNA_END=642 /DNA_ORIENTATION=+
MAYGVGVRQLSVTPMNRGIEDFFTVKPDVEKPLVVGREWQSEHLRLKSFDDLHKLWYILLKEQNALFTERYHAKLKRQQLEAPHRLRMVRKSMTRIKHVLTERAIEEAGGNEDQRKVMMRLINGPQGATYVNKPYPSKEAAASPEP